MKEYFFKIQGQKELAQVIARSLKEAKKRVEGLGAKGAEFIKEGEQPPFKLPDNKPGKKEMIQLKRDNRGGYDPTVHIPNNKYYRK